MKDAFVDLNTFPVFIQNLCQPSNFPHEVESFEVFETHISWVILTGSFAYKIKKPVRLSFIDLSTLAKRKYYCEEEFRLNHIFSPKLYLDVVPVFGNEEHPSFIGSGEPIDYAVRMHQFDPTHRLDQILETGIEISHLLEDFGKYLAKLHSTINENTCPHSSGTPEVIQKFVGDNFSYLNEEIVDPKLKTKLKTIQDWTQSQFSELKPFLIHRKHEGWIKECHGDLHLENLAWVDGEIQLFDRLEFSPDLRWIDPMNEIAFLTMDLCFRKNSKLSQKFLRSYLEHSGDYEGLRLLRYYQVYRAMVRAKVAAIQMQSKEGTPQFKSFYKKVKTLIEFTYRLLVEPERFLCITYGVSGSGKTTASQLLMEQSRAIVIRSDVERKRLFGLGVLEESRSNLNQGIYEESATRKTYLKLLQLAHAILKSGHSVIVDASFLDKEFRDLFLKLGREEEVKTYLLNCPQLNEDFLEERIVSRSLQSRDASEANSQVLKQQLAELDPLTKQELEDWEVIEKDEIPEMEASF